MILETPRLILRPFCNVDLNDLFEYSSQPGVGEMAGWQHHTTPEESRRVLEKNMDNPNIFAIEHRGNTKVIGHIAIHDDSENGREDTKELGFVLNQSYQRHGFMTEAIYTILNYLSSSQVRHVYACCLQQNIPSKGLIEKCGFVFEQEGTFYSHSMDKTFSSFEYVKEL